MEMKSILIKDTTKEQREQIVAEMCIFTNCLGYDTLIVPIQAFLLCNNIGFQKEILK